MQVLILGSGGREHAIEKKCQESPLMDRVFVAPGNGGNEFCIPLDLSNHDQIVEFVKNNEIDLTIVGPEDPLVNGIVDRFNAEQLKIFGPDKFSAQLEGSKDFAKRFMNRHKIPTAKHQTFKSLKSALTAINKFGFPLVIKADGLALGKGVRIVHNLQEATDFLTDIFVHQVFGKSHVLFEEFLEGEEASLLCVVSDNKLFPLQSARDYKRIGENDEGLNTGGVGCYSPSELFDDKLDQVIRETILNPIEEGLEKDGHHFTGILFIGLMIKDQIPKVIEFNVRFGDPETQVVLPRLKSDVVTLFLKALDKTLVEDDFKWSKDPCFGVVLVSKGYPEAYEKGFEIILPEFDQVDIIQNGTIKQEKSLLTNGGRVLTVTSVGEFDDSIDRVYEAVNQIEFEGKTYRRDIGAHLKNKPKKKAKTII